MPNPRPTVFVLWGEQFDEAIAALVITGLRKAGVRVKVIGLDGPCVKGAQGLALCADLTLDQALAQAHQAICVVVPRTTQSLASLKNDPRLRQFLEQTQAQGASLFLGNREAAQRDS